MPDERKQMSKPKRPHRFQKAKEEDLQLSVAATETKALTAAEAARAGSGIATMAASGLTKPLRHMTKQRPLGPPRRVPTRRHHPSEERKAGDLHLEFDSQTPAVEDHRLIGDSRDEFRTYKTGGSAVERTEDHQDDREAARRKAGQRGGVAMVPHEGFNPADMRKQLKSAQGEASRVVAPPGARGAGIGGFDASAARANLRSTGKKVLK